jgi:SprA-related family
LSFEEPFFYTQEKYSIILIAAMFTPLDTVSLASTLHNERAGVRLRSEPAQPITLVPGKDSRTSEKSQDKVTLSAEGLDRSRRTNTGSAPERTDASPAASGDQSPKNTSSPASELTPADLKMVQQLRQRDQEVKAHEMAHLASAGQHARGGPTYTYQQGPDGRRYAVGGEVPIDISKEKTPEATAEKMRAVKRAALAPAEPSSADRSIAAAAAALESEAHREQRIEEKNASLPAGEQSATQPTMTENSSEPPGASADISSGIRRHLSVTA